MTARRRIRVMVGLLALWAATTVVVFGVSSEPLRVPLENVTGTAASGAGTRGGRASGLQVNVKLFEFERSQRMHHYPPPKNIFVMQGRGQGAGAGSAGDLALDGVADPGPVGAGQGDAGAQSDAPTMQYLGFVGLGPDPSRGGVGVVAMGDEMQMVQVGDRLGARYTVAAVTGDTLTLTQRSTGRQIRLPIADVAPIAPSS